YEAMCAAARDDPWDETGLDRVYAAYRASEHAFRTAVDDFQGHVGNLPFRVSRRFLKPISEARAIAHRRRGTWA
ncbi:MAG: sulfotransferase family protein, partial [Mycobacterium sp.]